MPDSVLDVLSKIQARKIKDRDKAKRAKEKANSPSVLKAKAEAEKLATAETDAEDGRASTESLKRLNLNTPTARVEAGVHKTDYTAKLDSASVANGLPDSKYIKAPEWVQKFQSGKKAFDNQTAIQKSEANATKEAEANATEFKNDMEALKTAEKELANYYRVKKSYGSDDIYEIKNGVELPPFSADEYLSEIKRLKKIKIQNRGQGKKLKKRAIKTTEEQKHLNSKVDLFQ
jgi:hypothetical protein